MMHFFFHRLHGGGGRHRGRHHGFFGFDPRFGGGGDGFPGGMGGGPGGMGPGRKLGSSDLQLLLLKLLAEKPSHGYELIKALEERSAGYYAPSPSMVYPGLAYLEEVGHATVQTEGTKKLYSITPAGLAHLDENHTAVETLLMQLTWLGRKMAHLREAMGGRDGRGGRGERNDPVGEPDAGPGGDQAPELRVARYDLKLAVAEKARGDAEVQRRIAEVLRRAAAEIRAL